MLEVSGRFAARSYLLTPCDIRQVITSVNMSYSIAMYA